MLKQQDTEIKTLGKSSISSPLPELMCNNILSIKFISDDSRVLFDDTVCNGDDRNPEAPSFECAGPREKIFFDPSKTKAGIVTCGGLCPGLNDVVRAIVLGLWHNYGVRRIYGFQSGYRGFIPSYKQKVLELDPESIDGWQDLGGTKLGSSRGEQSPAEIVDCLERMSINMLFTIGGDGTMRGAQAIVEEIERRGAQISVIGVPKTIDNDIMYIDESFGFQTAYSEATQSLHCAHVEAVGAPNGIGLVKLMGRHSGFLACAASLATSDVNFVLIPEVPFKMETLLKALETRLEYKDHAVIVVAEGAGQDLIEGAAGKDLSGNAKLKDIGLFLKDKINDYFKSRNKEVSIKYIDPSYIIRSVPANPADSIYCLQLGHDSVHAAMAGKTAMMVGRWHNRLVHVPMYIATRERKQVTLDSNLWQSVLETTGMLKWVKE